MSHFGDYMDGVPVKISEKYKRPPRIDLPYGVSECPIRAQHVVDTAEYSTTFEKNVLAKIKELRSAKETKKNERRHRLQLLEEAKQKKLDEIAAVEAEEKLKQLSVSEVSYPSTDEISALSADEKADRNCDTAPTHDNSPETAEVTVSPSDMVYPTCSNAEPQLNILQPIPVQASYNLNSLLDDPDPLQELKMNTKITRVPHYRNVETLTFKDFEHDTSSPFDNVELKTINDMELLAQVLQSQRESTTSCPPQQPYMEPAMYATPNGASQAQIEGMSYMPATYMEQPIQGQSVMYSPQHYPMTNGYYVPTENICDNSMQMENVNMYMPNYQYYVPANSYNVVDPNYYPNQLPAPELNQSTNGYIPEPYYFHYPHVPMHYPPTYNMMQSNENQIVQNVNQNHTVENRGLVSNSQNTMKSRSRSVPDIVRELNEELASAKQRASERSYNASPAPKSVPQPTSSRKKEERRSKKKSEPLVNPYDNLPLPLQDMCRNIHGMGFPLDRVARVCTLVGDNDKKIIEGLLILGELMDLGFSERKASMALAKHEFNRDKALDELVS